MAEEELVARVRATTNTSCGMEEVRTLLQNVDFDERKIEHMIDQYFEGMGDLKALEQKSALWAEVDSKGRSKKKVRAGGRWRRRAAPPAGPLPRLSCPLRSRGRD